MASSALDYALALCDDNPMAPRSPGLTKAFHAILRAADRAGVRVCVCGGFARNVYLRPRTTDDADFLVRSTDDTAKVVAAAHDFTLRGAIEPVTRLVHEGGAKMDLIAAEYPFELEAMDAARPERVRRREVLVIPAVHLCAMKIDAAADPRRPEDFGEAVRLLVSGAADPEAVAAIIRRDLPARVPTLEAILRAVERAKAAPPKRPGRRQ